jgi:hypothetical protein
MRLPPEAHDDIKSVLTEGKPAETIACIMNPFPGREFLTRFEALDAINLLAGMLMSDERFAGGKPKAIPEP